MIENHGNNITRVIPLSKIPSWMKSALKQCKKYSKLSNATFSSKKMSAIILYGRKKFSYGYNVYAKTHPLYIDKNEKGDEFCRNTHAELMALTKCKYKIKPSMEGKLSIITYRELSNNKLGNSRPCKICQKILKEFGISKMIYFDGENFIIEKIK